MFIKSVLVEGRDSVTITVGEAVTVGSEGDLQLKLDAYQVFDYLHQRDIRTELEAQTAGK